MSERTTLEPTAATQAQVWERYSRECSKYAMPRITPVKQIVTGKSTHFDIRDYNTQGVAFVAAFELFAEHPQICIVTHIDCSNSAFEISACPTLNDLLESSNSLLSLNLTNTKIGGAGIARMSEGLHYMRTVTELILAGCDMRDTGGIVVASAFRNNDICTYLDLSNNQLGGETAKALGEMLERNEVLQTLLLGWNSFNAEEANVELLAGVQKNMSLLTLDLSWNGIACDETRVSDAFELMFKKQTTLQTLNLENNRISQNMASFANGIRRCVSINNIKLGGNPFTAADILEFLTPLIKGPPMKGLPKFISLGKYKWIDKEQNELLKKVLQANRGRLTVEFAGVMMSNPPREVDFPKILMSRIHTLGPKPKKKKFKRDMGQFFLALLKDEEVKELTMEDFVAKITAFGGKIDDALRTQIGQEWKHPKRNAVQLHDMANYYLSLFPTEWIEPIVKPPPKEKKGKGKGKGKDKGDGKGKGEGKGKGKAKK